MAVLAFLGFLVYNAPIYLVLVPIMVIVVRVSARKSRRHFEQFMQGREGESICTFARSFAVREVDTWVIRAVYEQLQEALAYAAENFPVRADDHLFDDLLLDEDDLDLDLIEEISERTGRSMENFEKNPLFGKVTTPRALVMLFNAQPMKEGQHTSTLGR